MRIKTVADVMTREVVCVDADMPYRNVVDLILGEDVSAVPVVDSEGMLIGAISETELTQPSAAVGVDPKPGARALKARDLMTRRMATVPADLAVARAGRRLAHSGLRSLFVVDGGRVVGVLARRDILWGFLRDDADIRVEIEHVLMAPTRLAHPRQVRVTVEDGVVWLTGRLPCQDDVAVAERLCRGVPGVVAVRGMVAFRAPGERPSR